MEIKLKNIINLHRTDSLHSKKYIIYTVVNYVYHENSFIGKKLKYLSYFITYNKIFGSMMMQNRLFSLPPEVIRNIYLFDPTYQHVTKDTAKEIWYSSWMIWKNKFLNNQVIKNDEYYQKKLSFAIDHVLYSFGVTSNYISWEQKKQFLPSNIIISCEWKGLYYKDGKFTWYYEDIEDGGVDKEDPLEFNVYINFIKNSDAKIAIFSGLIYEKDEYKNIQRKKRNIEHLYYPQVHRFSLHQFYDTEKRGQVRVCSNEDFVLLENFEDI